jgi:type I restriction enzyme S subunit
MNNIDTRGNFVWDEFIRVPVESDTSRNHEIISGDILFNNTNSVELVGKSGMFHGYSEPVVYSNHFTRIRVDKSRNDPSYLANWLIFQHKIGTFANLCNRWVGQSAVKNDQLFTLSIPLPPTLAEQERIARVLNEQIAAVEKARAAAEARLEAARALSNAYLREVFNGIYAERWPKTSIGKICEIIAGQSPPSISYNKKSEGLPFFQGKADFGDNYPIPTVWCNNPIKIALPGDILISVRAPVGPTNVADVECCIGRGLAAIRCKNNICADYVLWFMKYFETRLSELGSGSTFSAINMSQLSNILIPLPSSLSDQEYIALTLKKQIGAADEIISGIEGQLNIINALFAAFLRKAFKGGL